MLLVCMPGRTITRTTWKNTLKEKLDGLDQLVGELMGSLAVQLHPIAGPVPVVQVSIETREELPIFITSFGLSDPVPVLPVERQRGFAGTPYRTARNAARPQPVSAAFLRSAVLATATCYPVPWRATPAAKTSPRTSLP